MNHSDKTGGTASQATQCVPSCNFENGKNFLLTNPLALARNLYNPALGKETVTRIYGKFDLLVDGEIKESPEDYWMVMEDLDGASFARPVSARILADKLMTGGFSPMKEELVR